MAVPPRGAVAFLFSDSAGSTRLWAERPVAMAWAIAEHDAALRDAVAGAGGVMYKVIGDGAQIAFADPIAALVAASAALRSFDAIVIEGEDGE